METTILSAPGRIPFSATTRLRTLQKTPRYSPSVVSVLTRPSSLHIKDDDDHGLKITATTSKTVYKDNWFEHIAIDYLSQAVQETIGMKNDKSGYESLVVAAGAAFRSFNPDQQRQLVTKALEKAIPGPILFLIRTLMPPSKFSREYFAAFTIIFFPWLVGPCEVRESEFEGSKEKNVVHIKKCRFLEETNCVGMCTNLCKVPSQAFIKNSFGIPVNMVPNFDDMSCEMIFGQDPPAQEDDPAFKQPCYKLCKTKIKHSTSCIS